MDLEDAYSELGLKPGASAAAVKAAWRRLVSRWHPDRNAAAEAALLIQRINVAYERLRDVVPAEAPRAGRASSRRPAQAETDPQATGAEADGDAPPPDPARDADARTGDRPETDADEDLVVRRRVRLSIEEAVRGCVRTLHGRQRLRCTACDGLGLASAPERCSRCDGAGQVRAADWWTTWPPRHVACPDCDGRGQRARPCAPCEGRGTTLHRYRCSVRLPAGVRDGDTLSAPGGGAARGGLDGRLSIEVRWRPHPWFRIARDGVLHAEVPVDGYAWLAGGWLDVPAPRGLLQMRLTRGRRVYRLAGQGLPAAAGEDGAAGDYVVTVHPRFTEAPDAEQQALLERLAAISRAQPSAALGRWQDALRDWAEARASDD